MKGKKYIRHYEGLHEMVEATPPQLDAHVLLWRLHLYIRNGFYVPRARKG